MWLHQRPSRGRMRIAGPVAVVVVLAMHGHPGDRRAFAGQRAQQAQQPPHPGIGLEAAVGQQPVVAQADAQAAGHPRQHEEGTRPCQVKTQRRRQCADMQRMRSKRSSAIPAHSTSQRVVRPTRGRGGIGAAVPLPASSGPALT